MKQDFNFIQSYRIQSKQMVVAAAAASGKNHSAYGYVAGGIAVVAVAGISLLGMAGLNLYDNMRITELKTEVNAPEVTKAIGEIDALNAQAESLLADQTRLTVIDNSDKAAKQLKREEIAGIYSSLPATAVIQTMNYQKGLITMEVEASDKNQCNLFADNLQKLSFMQYATYTGFATSEGKASFTVTCYTTSYEKEATTKAAANTEDTTKGGNENG